MLIPNDAALGRVRCELQLSFDNRSARRRQPASAPDRQPELSRSSGSRHSTGTLRPERFQ